VKVNIDQVRDLAEAPGDSERPAAVTLEGVAAESSAGQSSVARSYFASALLELEEADISNAWHKVF
jgi:hypothetical protein